MFFLRIIQYVAMSKEVRMLPPVNPEVFQRVELGMLDTLNEFTKEDLRPFLPILIRSGLLLVGDISGRPKEFRHGILVPLSDIEAMNLFVALLSVDYTALEGDVKKELQLRYITLISIYHLIVLF